MVPAPLAFEQVSKEVGFAQAPHLGHAEFGEAPERFDAVDVVFTARKLVLVVVDAMMPEPIQHEAVVGAPAIGVDGAGSKHLAADNRA